MCGFEFRVGKKKMTGVVLPSGRFCQITQSSQAIWSSEKAASNLYHRKKDGYPPKCCCCFGKSWRGVVGTMLSGFRLSFSLSFCFHSSCIASSPSFPRYLHVQSCLLVWSGLELLQALYQGASRKEFKACKKNLYLQELFWVMGKRGSWGERCMEDSLTKVWSGSWGFWNTTSHSWFLGHFWVRYGVN
jgi:hypothetical protein